jgi:hypothetical protein
MSLSISTALREGVDRFLSRTAAILIAVYVPAMLLYQLSVNGLIGVVLARYLSAAQAREAIGVTYPAPTAVYAAVSLAVLVGMSAFTVVAVRTFVAGATDRIPREFYTRRLPWATANLIVGGLAYGLLVFLGTLLLVIPGIVAYVGFVFVTMFVAVEDENFVAALRDSWRLVRPSFLSVLALLLVLVVGLGVISAVVGMVVSYGALAAGLDGWTGVATGLVTAPLSLLVLAILAAAFDQLRGGGATDATPTPAAPRD